MWFLWWWSQLGIHWCTGKNIWILYESTFMEASQHQTFTSTSVLDPFRADHWPRNHTLPCTAVHCAKFQQTEWLGSIWWHSMLSQWDTGRPGLFQIHAAAQSLLGGKPCVFQMQSINGGSQWLHWLFGWCGVAQHKKKHSRVYSGPIASPTLQHGYLIWTFSIFICSFQADLDPCLAQIITFSGPRPVDFSSALPCGPLEALRTSYFEFGPCSHSKWWSIVTNPCLPSNVFLFFCVIRFVIKTLDQSLPNLFPGPHAWQADPCHSFS